MKLTLKNPLEKIEITQRFGENKACINNTTGKVISKNTKDTCPVGYRSVYGAMKGHNGWDIRAKHGQPVYACAEGFVEEVQTEEERGLGLGIITENKYDCPETGKESFFKLRYWHLKGFVVSKGDKVKAGDLIAWADNTGLSSGDHLHLEIKPVEYKKGKWENTLQFNGYLGAVDPDPYFKDDLAHFDVMFKKETPQWIERFKKFYRLFTKK